MSTTNDGGEHGGGVPEGEDPGGAAPSRHPVRRALTWGALAVLAVVVVAGGVVVGVRAAHPLGDPTVRTGLAPSPTVPGGAPSLPWPTTGQAAVSIPSLGYERQSGPELPVPIASLTKMLTAVVVLHDHPIPAGSEGPPITVTPADAAQFDIDEDLDESTIEIQAGEVLSERQMLEALLIVSANDIAYTLAAWDAGTEAAFVAKMNVYALSLGATSSHFVDASGYDPASRSTAADVLRIAAAGMRDPTFAEVVAMPSLTLPLVGTQQNIVREIGSDGIVGVKSGFTSAAGGCYVLAGIRTVAGRQVTVLVAVLSQPVSPPAPAPTTTSTPAPSATTRAPPAAPTTTTTTVPPEEFDVPEVFRYASPYADRLLRTAEDAIVPVTVAAARAPVGTATTSWGKKSYRIPVVTAQGAWLVGWPGQRVATAAELRPVAPGSREGSRVGSAYFSLGTQIEVVPLELSSSVPEPSLWWRLVHGD